VTQGARTDPGEGTSGIAPPVITLEDTIAPLVEKIIAREEKDREIKENKVPLTPNHKSEDESEDEQTSHSGDTSVTLSNNDTSNSHNISQAQSRPSASSTPARASSMELSLDTSSIKSRMKSAKGRLTHLGKRLNTLAENIRAKKTRSTSRISEEEQDESILESECPDAYRGHTSRPRAKGARKTTLCHIAQCLARGPDLVEDEADDITLQFYDTMTVTEALIACTLTAGTRFDMTRQSRSRINIQYGEWGEPAMALPDYCSNSWNECDHWLETTMFWPSIQGVGMVLFDCEHWSEREIDRMV
jgi:hypothetical protein